MLSIRAGAARLPRRDGAFEGGKREGFAQHVMPAEFGLAARFPGIAGDEKYRDVRALLQQTSDHLGARSDPASARR